MKKHFLPFTILMTITLLFAHESDLVFRSNSVSEIRISIDQDKLDWIYANVSSDSLHPASVTFENENLNIGLDSVGFRLRGNTSRNSAKKSFKLDFNEFVKGQTLAGIEKFNLKAEQNDPSLIRSKFAFDLYEKIGVPASRVCYTAVYINENYYGLYEIIEHIDERFLDYHIDDDTGNLWKCLWPADLNYRGPHASDYFPYSDDTKPYELKTNEDTYDYSELAHLIDVINNTPSAQMKDSLESVLKITDFIKYLAVNVMTGSWDDYRYLRNNFYLYHDPSHGQFRFIPYDYDNTFGIDWVEGGNWGEPNWTRINMYSYICMDNDGRPLADLIFNTPEYRDLFTHFIDFYTNHVFREDQWRDYGDSIKALIRPYVALDTYYPRDHGFNMDDFDDSYNTDYRNGHVERGLYEFMRKRRESTNSQISWQHAGPSIYEHKLEQNGATAEIDISLFSQWGITNVVLKTYNEQLSEQSNLAFTRNRKTNTSKVEKYDRWSIEAFLGDNDKLYKIVAADSLGVQSSWPRSGYAQFQENGSSTLPLVINEIMASNASTIADPAGEFDDWVELYNPSSTNIDLSGLYLSDNPTNLNKWAFPQGTIIAAQGYLLIWCDEDGDKAQDGLHANFKLSATGEFIALSDQDGLLLVDSLSFGAQTTDISYGRVQDASSIWTTFSEATPGYSNNVNSISENIPLTTSLDENYPNPFNPTTTIPYQLSEPGYVDLSIYNLNGQRVETLIRGQYDAGMYSQSWNATELASGVYLYILRLNGTTVASRKMLLVK